MQSVDLEIVGVALARAFVVTTMISVGFQVPLARVASLRHRPRVVFAALGVSFVVMPAAAALLAAALALEAPVAAGLVVLACAAGATMGVKLADIGGGDVADAVALMFVLAATTAFTLGPTAALLLESIGATGAGIPSLDPLAVLGLLTITQLAPLLLGLVLHVLAPSSARRLRPLTVALASTLFVLGVPVLVIDALDEFALLGVAPLAAIVVVVLLGLVSGQVAAGPGTGRRRAVALLAGERSAAVALIAVAGLGVPLATATVVACGVCMLLVNTAAALAWRLGTRTAMPRAGSESEAFPEEAQLSQAT